MNIIIFTSEFPPGPGGIGTHAYQVANQLHNFDCKVVVVACQNYTTKEEIDQFNASNSFPVIRLQSYNNSIIEALYRGWMMWKTYKQESIDVILATGAKSVWIMPVISLLTGVRWCAVGHGTEFGVRGFAARHITRWSFSRADAVICVSNFTKSLMEKIGIANKRTHVIPNGADDQLFKPADISVKVGLLSKLKVEPDSILLLTVGNVTKRKGQEVVIRALPKVCASFPNVHYLVVGLPTEIENLSSIADELNVTKNVLFMGKVNASDLVELYQACDIFLMTSRKLSDGDVEGFGISVIEAALCVKPAIVSKGSGLEEAIIDGVTGLAVNENDPEQTADAVLHLLNNPKLLAKMGEQAYERAQANYSWKEIGKRYYGILNEVVSG